MTPSAIKHTSEASGSVTDEHGAVVTRPAARRQCLCWLARHLKEVEAVEDHKSVDSIVSRLSGLSNRYRATPFILLYREASATGSCAVYRQMT